MAKNRIEFWFKDDNGLYRRLPVNPSEFDYSSPYGINTVNIANLGEVAILGERGLKQISFSSFFPRDYNPSYCEYEGFPKPAEWVKLFEKWRDKRVSIRLIITGTFVSIPVFISEFTLQPERAGHPGDIFYSMTLVEHRQVSAKIVQTTKAKSTSTVKTTTKTPTKKTYTVVKGDSLWKIAKRFYGAGSKWPTIYNANKAVVGKNPDKIYPGQKLVIP